MKRRDFLQLAALSTAQFLLPVTGRAQASPRGSAQSLPVKSFKLEEATIAEVQAAMYSGKESAVSLTKRYLGRIEELDRRGPALRAVIEINPDALAIARELDRERKTKGPRGPLHGIPVLIKDNIDTQDRMMTTAGSLALIRTGMPCRCCP